MRESYAKYIVKGGSAVFLALIISQILAFGIRVFLARPLLQQDLSAGVPEGYHFGLVYGTLAFISLFPLFRNIGIPTALIKYVSQYFTQRRFKQIKSLFFSALTLQLSLSILIAILIIVFAEQVAFNVFKSPEATLLIQILALWLIGDSVFTVILSSFQGLKNMLTYSIIRCLHSFLLLALMIAFVGFLDLGALGAIIAYTVNVIFVSIFGMFKLFKSYPKIFKKIKPQISMHSAKILVSFGIPVFLGSIASMILTSMDTIMIAFFRTLPEVGLYQAAQPTAKFLWYFPMTLSVLTLPMFSEIWARRDKKLLQNVLYILTRFSFFLIIPACFLFIAFPGEILRILFGEEYVAGATVLQILAVAAIIYTVYSILGQTIIGIGKPIVGSITVAIMAVINLILNILLIPSSGIVGAALASLFAYMIGFIFLFNYLQKLMKFQILDISIFKMAVGGVLTLLIIFVLKSFLNFQPLVEAAVLLILGTAIYLLWTLKTNAITQSDLLMIKNVAPIPKWILKIAKRK